VHMTLLFHWTPHGLCPGLCQDQTPPCNPLMC
jgi:hypothetical protein